MFAIFLYSVQQVNEREGAIQAMTALVVETAGALDITLDLSPEVLGAIVTAVADGLTLQRLANPDSVPDELFVTALRLLIGSP